MNVFRYAVTDLNLTGASEHFLLLSMLADAQDANPVSNTYSDPYREILYRLRAYSNSLAYIALAQLVTHKIK